MIVGTKTIPLSDLINACSSDRELSAFTLALVPRFVRHIDEIVNNQKYIVALELRGIAGIPYKIKKELSENLLTGVVVKGTINTIIDIEDVMASVDMNTVFKYLFKTELKVYDARNDVY